MFPPEVRLDAIYNDQLFCFNYCPPLFSLTPLHHDKFGAKWVDCGVKQDPLRRKWIFVQWLTMLMSSPWFLQRRTEKGCRLSLTGDDALHECMPWADCIGLTGNDKKPLLRVLVDKTVWATEEKVTDLLLQQAILYGISSAMQHMTLFWHKHRKFQ